MLLWGWPWGFGLVQGSFFWEILILFCFWVFIFYPFYFFLVLACLSMHIPPALLGFGFSLGGGSFWRHSKSCLFLNEARLWRNNKQIPRKRISTVFKKAALEMCVWWGFFPFGDKRSFPVSGQDTGGRDFLLRERELPEFVIKSNNNNQVMTGKLSLRG